MSFASEHARIASSILATIDHTAVLLPAGRAELAAAHAQASRAWSAIGRDQSVTEAAARRRQCSAKAGER